MDSVEDAKTARVGNWLAENVRVITQANELRLSDFIYNCKSPAGNELFDFKVLRSVG